MDYGVFKSKDEINVPIALSAFRDNESLINVRRTYIYLIKICVRRQGCGWAHRERLSHVQYIFNLTGKNSQNNFCVRRTGFELRVAGLSLPSLSESGLSRWQPPANGATGTDPATGLQRCIDLRFSLSVKPRTVASRSMSWKCLA